MSTFSNSARQSEQNFIKKQMKIFPDQTALNQICFVLLLLCSVTVGL
jgi:hypothetical protein